MSPSELNHLLLDTKNAKLNIIKYRKDIENEIKRLETGVNNLRGKPQYNTAILKLQGQINILKSLLKVSLRRPTVSSGTLVLETRSTVSPLTTESTVELVPQQTLLPIQQEQKELLVIPTNKLYFDSLKTWNSWVENPRLLYLLYYNLSNFIPDQFKFTPTFLVKDNEKEEVTPINRSQLREKLRIGGYNPYDLSGSDRKILRKAYNGEELLSEDNPLFSIFQLIKEYKKGGILFAKKGQKNSFASNLSNITEKAKIKALQNRLYNLGAFGNISRKAVDGVMGPLTKKAMERAKLLETVKKKDTQTDNKEKSSKDKHYTEIDPKDKKEFAKWLYEEGKDNLIGNMFDTGTALIKSFSGIGSSVNVGEGTKKQLVALHLFDNNNISNKGDVIEHVIGKDSKGDYRWKNLNGNLQVHNDKSILVKSGTLPGEHIAGQYTVYETPNNYHISDVYNFNNSGTDYAKKLIDSDAGTFYDKLRYYAGTYGSNKDLPLEVDVPKEIVLLWYNDFKSGKGVRKRTLKIQSEYNNKGYVGHGRQSYL